MMKLSTYATITAIVAFIYGIALLFFPVKFIENYGITLDNGGVLLTRFFGSAMCGNAILFWLNRNISSSEKSWSGVLISSVFFNIINAIIAVMAIMNGIGNSMGWSTVVISVIFAFGSGYFASRKSA